LASCDGDDDESAADLSMPVVVEKIKRADIADFISTTGTLRAAHEEAITAEVEGILHLLSANGAVFSNGRSVKKGQLLAELENPGYLLDVRVESQKLASENARRELEKQEKLFREGGVTEKELEIARKNALDAGLNYESAELKAGKLKLLAPIKGYVANLQTNYDGIRVPAGFQLCKIMDYSTVLAKVNLPNSDIGVIQLGQEVNVTNYALKGEVFKGRVISIDPAVDPQTRTFNTTIEIENHHLRLRPGMFVKTDVIIENRKDAIVIPKSAVQTRDGRPVAFIVKGLSAELREITTGIETKEEIEVIAGLAEDERLVVKGQETLRDKSKVRVTE
jgi:RND family efflux transporter MFP subunit